MLTTTYDDLVAAEEREIAAFRSYDKACVAVAGEVLAYIRKEGGWPDDALKRIEDPASMPEHIGRSVGGGWFDAKGRYTFRLGVKLSNISLERYMRVLRHDGEWYVGIGDREAIKVDRRDHESIEPVSEMLADIVGQAIRTFYPER